MPYLADDGGLDFQYTAQFRIIFQIHLLDEGIEQLVGHKTRWFERAPGSSLQSFPASFAERSFTPPSGYARDGTRKAVPAIVRHRSTAVRMT